VALLVATSREPGRVVETAHPIAPLVSAGTRVDGLAALLALVVTLVATLVQVYSTAYLRGDTRLPTYAGRSACSPPRCSSSCWPVTCSCSTSGGRDTALATSRSDVRLT